MEHSHAPGDQRSETSRLLRSIADNFPDGTLSVIAADLTVEFTAGLGFRRYGLDPQSFVGLPVAGIFAPYGETIQRTIVEAYRETFQGRPQSFEIAVDGEHHSFQTVPLPGPDGAIDRILSVGRNVTEQTVAARVLRSRERQQSAVARLGQIALGGAPLDVVTGEAAGLVATTLGVDLVALFDLLPDRSGLRLHAGVGWRDGLVGHAVVPVTGDSPAAYTLASRQPVIVDDLPSESRFSGSQLLTEHGAVSGLSVIVGSSDRPMGVLCACTRRHRTFTDDDIHMLQATANVVAAAVQRYLAEQTLGRNETRFRSLIENVSDLVTVLDLSGRIAYLSPSVERMLGYAAGNLLGHNAIELIHADDVPRVKAARRAALARPGASITLECRIRHCDGTWRTIDSVGRQIDDGNDEPQIVVNSRDVTERRVAEVALRAREAELARQGRLFREVETTARVGGWELNVLTGALYWTDETVPDSRRQSRHLHADPRDGRRVLHAGGPWHDHGRHPGRDAHGTRLGSGAAPRHGGRPRDLGAGDGAGGDGRRPGRPPVRWVPGRHRAPPARGAAPPGAEDGSGGPARRRRRARLQQPADRHPWARRELAADAPARGPGARESISEIRQAAERAGGAHAAAARVQPAAGAAAARSST